MVKLVRSESSESLENTSRFRYALVFKTLCETRIRSSAASENNPYVFPNESSDLPPLKWSSLKYDFRMEDKINGKEEAYG